LDKNTDRFEPPASPGWSEVAEILELIREVNDRKPIEGMSISGGEPFEQPEALIELLKGAKKLGLSTLVFTGFTLEELAGMEEVARIFDPEPLLDALIDGPFDETQPVEGELRGSANQRIHLLTDRYRQEDLIPPGQMECIVRRDGTVFFTGFTRPRRK
jgi:anaerobic ribonucleoside-triphosphate reductase activating protein